MLLARMGLGVIANCGPEPQAIAMILRSHSSVSQDSSVELCCAPDSVRIYLIEDCSEAENHVDELRPDRSVTGLVPLIR
jgi:hypothetical protein